MAPVDPRLKGLGAALALAACVASPGCTYSLPLGGSAVGRGSTLGDDRLQFMASMGSNVEVAATLPLITDEFGNEVNPLPLYGRPATFRRAVDPLGFAYGFSDRFDVGVSFSRGLHSFIEIAGDDRWALSVSPALYRYSSSEGGASAGFGHRKGAVTNANVSGLISFTPPMPTGIEIEPYVGGGVNRYSAWIESDRQRVERVGVVPSVVGGLRLSRIRWGRVEGSTRDAMLVLTMGFEAAGTWITQRSTGRVFVPTGRFFVSVGGLNR